MRTRTLDALAECGRGRVMECYFPPSVAIRYDQRSVPSPDDQRYLMREGVDIDAAGEAAARAYADHLRRLAAEHTAQADRIIRALERP